MPVIVTDKRLRYYEAFHTLYQENIFHFRGTPGLLAFRSSISTLQWQAIRHVHFSTFYTPNALWDTQDEFWPPENPLNWTKMVDYLHDLPSLSSLRLDMIFSAWSGLPSTPRRVDNLIIQALIPLKDVKATDFEVEVNVTPSKEVWTALGDVNFVIVVRERDYNVELHGPTPWLTL
jgi:hypothetical protein